MESLDFLVSPPEFMIIMPAKIGENASHVSSIKQGAHLMQIRSQELFLLVAGQLIQLTSTRQDKPWGSMNCSG